MLLLAALVFVALASPSSETGTKPSLRAVTQGPVVAVIGHGFRPGERVRVTLLGSISRAARTTYANQRGGVKASFRLVADRRCSALIVAAVGSKGSRATARVGRRPCIPPPRQ